jgi:hypothetical protein
MLLARLLAVAPLKCPPFDDTLIAGGCLVEMLFCALQSALVE